MQQLSMFDLMAPPPPASSPRPVDHVKERILASGLVQNEYLLTLGSSPRVKPISDLPSRMFQFPTEYVDGVNRDDGQTAILLNHPDLATFPFVDEVESAVGIRPIWEPLDRFGRASLFSCSRPDD